jgi:hypothetical protein
MWKQITDTVEVDKKVPIRVSVSVKEDQPPATASQRADSCPDEILIARG